MALALDGSTPAQASGTAGSATTAGFTAPSGAILVATVAANNDTAGANVTIAMSDTGSLSWSAGPERDQGDGGAQDGHASIWYATTASAVSRTVTASASASVGAVQDVVLNVFVLTGQDTTDPIGASGEGSSTTNDITPTIFTSEAANSWAVVVGSDWSAQGAPTSSDLTETSYDRTATYSATAGYKSLGAAGSQSANLNGGGAGATTWNWAAIEIKEQVTPKVVAWIVA